MEIRRFISPMLDHNMYTLAENGHGVAIDPFYCNDSRLLMDDLQMDFMLVTHEHFDHIRGVNEMKQAYGIPLLANAKCNINMQSPTKNFAKFYEAYIKFQQGKQVREIPFDDQYTCSADAILEDGQCIEWQGHTLQVKLTPGHSAGSNVFILDNKCVFSGDVLLAENIPADRFPGGSKKDFREITLPYLKSLDPKLKIYPGHEESFLLGSHYLLRGHYDTTAKTGQ